MNMANEINQNLIESLLLLASDYEVQVSLFPEFVHIPDEIVLAFDEVFLVLDKSSLEPELLSMLNRIDEYTAKMSEDKSLWSLDKLRNSREWEDLRSMAKEVLDFLGIKQRKPRLEWVKFVK